ncbi:MAG: hypothetical protein HUK21_01905 [Fibrobacteraceae bacterium]|nr:hypothetical protein [Fibrobacteraceae bacterium]
MNLENMNLLSQKIEGVLSTMRNLKGEVARLQQQLNQANTALQDKSALLEASNADLADCKAALDARANQVSAQEDIINQHQTSIEELNAQLLTANQKANDLESVINKLGERISTLNSENATLAGEKEILESECESLRAEKETLTETIQAQGEEISLAQERFQQLLSTIEKELDTEIPIEDIPVIRSENVIEEFDQTTSEETEEPTEPTQELVEDTSLEDDLDVVEEAPEEPIEVHPANEKENDLFSASNGGSQTNFFG